MKPQEIIEGNELIAEFMGIKLLYYSGESGMVDIGRKIISLDKWARYHTSWDWLMPVVEKIQSMQFKFIIGDSNRVTVYNKDYDWRNESTDDALKDCVWCAVTEFIKWHNSYLKTTK